jgi:hypothetical protein
MQDPVIFLERRQLRQVFDPSVAPELRHRLAHGKGRREERGPRIDGDGEAEFAETPRRKIRRASRFDHVGQRWRRYARGDFPQLGLAFRRFDEDDVGPGLGVRAAAPDGFRQAVVGACVGSRDDQRLGVEPAVDGGPQALLHFLDRHDFAAGFVTAFLGAGLILELHRAGAGRFELAHRPAHHDHAAVSDIGIGDQRHGRHGAQTANPLGHLGEHDQPHIGKSEHRRGLSVTGHVDRLESGLLDQQRRERVVGARRGHDLAALDQAFSECAAPLRCFVGHPPNSMRCGCAPSRKGRRPR